MSLDPSPSAPPRPTSHEAAPDPDPGPRTRDRRPPRNRVAATDVARALDEIIELTQLQRPYRLYRHVAERAGVHPTTVLRYHQGFLGTANATLHRCVEELLERVRRGDAAELQMGGGGGPRPRTRSSRVPAAEVRERIDSIQHALGLDEQQFLYRYLAQQVGMHPTTVLRYHRGDLQTAPAELVDALQALDDRIARGEVVSFCRSPEGRGMVVRERTIEVLDKLLEISGTEHKAGLFRALDEQLHQRPGTVARIFYDHKLRFVRSEIHRGLERLTRRTEYDPCRVYGVGERVHHHLYGTGTVSAKVHKNKVEIRFAGDRTVLLAEAVPEDPFLHVRSSGWGVGPGRGLSTRGLAS